MAEIKTIKNINEKTWTKFKAHAAENNMKLGSFFESLVQNHEKDTQEFWAKILNNRRIISEKEANDLNLVIRESRKEYGFRK